ncbi:MAG: acetyltransferase [Bacillota bacterium]|nr:acetyltransferase [Bacillota bacterium]
MKSQYNETTDIILVGAGGHAKVVIHIIKKYYGSLNIVGIIDKDPAKEGKFVEGVPVLGSDEKLAELYISGVRKAFIAVGLYNDLEIRKKLYDTLVDLGYELINLEHDSCIIENDRNMGNGNIIMANAVLNTGSKIGSNCILNTGSIVEHDTILGDNVHIAPGAIICGGVQIGDNCFLGAGSTVVQGVKIGNNVIVGAGSVVIKDVPPYTKVVGVPARII